MDVNRYPEVKYHPRLEYVRSTKSQSTVKHTFQMLAFALSLFPLTGVLGAGQFVQDQGFQYQRLPKQLNVIAQPFIES